MPTPTTVCDPALLSLIEALCAERLGRANLHGAALAQAVRRVSEIYLRQRGAPADLRADAEARCARLKFFLPRDLPKIVMPLSELAAVHALPARPALRVLDIGAGFGATSLGVIEFARSRAAPPALEIHALDIDGSSLAIAQQLCARWARARQLQLAMTTTTSGLTPTTLSRTQPPYDLIVIGFVLNELAETDPDPVLHHLQWLLRLSELLSPDGALIVLEPALKHHSRVLQQVRSALVQRPGPPFVFAPCLHRGPCPLLQRERDWCHQQLPLAFPPQLAAIALGAGLRAEGPSYSYLTLHRQPRSLGELDVTSKLARIVSGQLPSKGKREFMLCGEDMPERMRRLDRHASRENSAVEQLQRGNIVRIDPPAPLAASTLDITVQTRLDVLCAPDGHPR